MQCIDGVDSHHYFGVNLVGFHAKNFTVCIQNAPTSYICCIAQLCRTKKKKKKKKSINKADYK